MAEYFLRKWFEDQLRFRLPDGTEGESVSIGNAVFSPVEILKDFNTTYKQEFDWWLNEDWKPRQYELREELLSYSGNRNRYRDLKDTVRRQQVIPFVGSGMSVPSGLPTWSEFLINISEFTSHSSSDLKKLLRSSSFEEAADLLASGTNPRLLAERIEHDLRIDDPKVVDGPIGLLPRLFPSLLITTNLDDVLEHLYGLCNSPFGHVVSGSQIANYRQIKGPTEKILLKLHGDCRNQEGRVLLSTEYEASYAPGNVIHDELILIYQQNSLLFLGCSLGPDRSVRLIERVANADKSMPKHYAFLAKPRTDADRIGRENFLTDRGIYAIWYELPHNEAIAALLDGLHEQGTY